MLFNPFLNNNGRYALTAVLLLAIVGVIAMSSVTATLRATQSAFSRVQNKHYNVNHRLLDYENANNTLFDAATTLSIDETLRPFGPDILNGYDTCDDFEADVVKVLIARGKNYIQSNLNTSCGGENRDLYVFNRTFHKNRRATRTESSFETNNQVSDVEEIGLIKSDGNYIYIGQYDKIFVSDLNGNVIENITVRSPGASSLELASIFFNENILTALATIQICPDQVTPCYGSIDALIYQFNPTAKSLMFIDQYSLFYDYLDMFDARMIGRYLYLSKGIGFGSLEPLYRCSDDFKSLPANDYETAALDYLYSNVIAIAKETIVSILKEGAAETCKNIMKLSNETVHSYFLGITKVLLFGSSDSAPNTFESTIYFAPFASILVPSHVTKDSLLIHARQEDELNSLLVKFDVNGSVLIPTAVGIIDGVIGSQYDIDLYNGHYRIATGPQVFILEEKNLQLQIVGQLKDFGSTLSEWVSWVRFIADKGFIITYGNTQNLKVINLSSPTNPKVIITVKSTDLFYGDLHPGFLLLIENGKYFLSFSYQVSKVNATGFTIHLFKVNEDSVEEMDKAETILMDNDRFAWMIYPYTESDGSPHAFRYLPQSHKLIIPAHLHYDPYYYCCPVPPSYDGFLVYDVDLEKGVRYIGNVTHDETYHMGCAYFSPQSMVFNNDLITFMGPTIKRTSSIGTLSTKKWETDYCW